MQSLMNFMLFLLFMPVIISIILLVKRIRETPDRNRAREELLNDLMSFQNKNVQKDDETVKGSEQAVTSDPERPEMINYNKTDELSLSEEDLAVKKAKENAAALIAQTKAEELIPDPEKKKKDEAAEKVMQMMIQGKKSGFSKTELDSMIAEFSNNKK